MGTQRQKPPVRLTLAELKRRRALGLPVPPDIEAAWRDAKLRLAILGHDVDRVAAHWRRHGGSDADDVDMRDVAAQYDADLDEGAKARRGRERARATLTERTKRLEALLIEAVKALAHKYPDDYFKGAKLRREAACLQIQAELRRRAAGKPTVRVRSDLLGDVLGLSKKNNDELSLATLLLRTQALKTWTRADRDREALADERVDPAIARYRRERGKRQL